MDLLTETFPGDVAAVGNARAAVEHELREAGMEEFVDRARLVVDELVWNVVIHAHTAAVVRLQATDGDVRIDVADGGDGTPTLLHPGPEALSGRGLLIVDEISEEWGWYPVTGGKVTWARLTEDTDQAIDLREHPAL